MSDYFKDFEDRKQKFEEDAKIYEEEHRNDKHYNVGCE